MSNCSIWVEGISDRLYLKSYLYAYCKHLDVPEFIDSYHYSFFEYAGSNLAHFMFDDNVEDKHIRALSLSNNIFLTSDEDISKEAKHEALRAFKSDSFEYHTTGAIEIENTISSTILKRILIDILDLEVSRVSRMKIQSSDYRSKPIGDFIIDRKYSTRKLRAASGTLTSDYKAKFSNYVYNGIYEGSITWEDIKENPDAVRLTKAMYKFIKSINKPHSIS